MGFEDEVEQSHGRPCRLADGRSKRTCELTSSTVPRGTSFHCWVDLEFSPIGAERFSCYCRGWLPGPPELGAINPHACMMTANRRANATIAFFIPRRLA